MAKKQPHFDAGQFDKVWVDEDLPMDAELRKMTRSQAMKLDKLRRMRWFYLVQVEHKELKRVSKLLYSLLDPFNGVRIICIVGMTSAGKTALARHIIPSLIEQMYGPVPDCYLPSIYSKAPANGDNRIPWSAMYTKWLEACREPFIERKRTFDISDGVIKALRGHSPALATRKDALVDALRFRRVKVLVLDEVLHLLRFEDYAACMDTLKDLSESGETKLVLFGPFESARIVCQYGQALGRTAIIHFQRYVKEATKFNSNVEPSDDCDGRASPDVAKDAGARKGFKHVARTLQSLWPAEKVPPLEKLCDEYLFPNCFGGVGLLKKFALRLLSLQLLSQNEELTTEMVRDAANTREFVRRLTEEVTLGESLVDGALWGQSSFAEEDAFKSIAEIMKEAA